MNKPRQNARTLREISSYLTTIKAIGRPEMTHIHLRRCDFEMVERKPTWFDCTKQPDGRIVTVFNGKLIDVVAVS